VVSDTHTSLNAGRKIEITAATQTPTNINYAPKIKSRLPSCGSFGKTLDKKAQSDDGKKAKKHKY
jgi:hypothetical protein